MLDQANYTPRLLSVYRETVRPAMKEEFGYKNDMQIPRLDKIVLNIGAGAEAVRDSKKAKSAQDDLSTIAGQRAVVTKAKKSIAGFRVREDMPLGSKVTLRGDRMYEFLDRLITVAMPRIRASTSTSAVNFWSSAETTTSYSPEATSRASAASPPTSAPSTTSPEIGRASCRERV